MREADLTIHQKSATHPECETVVKIDNHEHATNHARKDKLELVAKLLCGGQMFIVLASKLVLGSKCCGISNRRDDFFCNCASEGVRFQ